MRLLLIEDSESLRRSLKIGLVKLGYSVDTSGDGAEGLSMALMCEYDGIILDLMLPSIDGMTILETLRKSKNDTRVLILSARAEPETKITGILSGADDYLSKPFSFDELHARLINLMRRGSTQNHFDIIKVKGFELNLQLKSISFANQNIDLTPNEYKVLECLFVNRNRITTAEKLSEYISGQYDSISKNAIEAHLSSARKKARKLGADLPIKNKRGFGYQMLEGE